MSDIKVIAIPKLYSITTNNDPLNPNYPGEELLDPYAGSDRTLLSLDWGAGLFEPATAHIQIHQRIPSVWPMPSFGGLWEIRVNGKLVFTGFAEETTKDRAMGGQIYTFNLRSVLAAWDVLLTNTTFGITGSGADHIVNNMTDYLSYLIKTVSDLSGIFFHGTNDINTIKAYIPYNLMSFSNLYENGVYSAVNTTYLAEIQKACEALGYIVFAEANGRIGIINALSPPQNVIFTSSLHKEELLSGSFSTAISQIPATVLVNDDISQIGKSYGHYPSAGIPIDNTNYSGKGAFKGTKLNNIAFATTTGMKPEALPTIAQQIFDISRKASQVLTFRTATILTADDILGYQTSWSDSIGNTGIYTIQKYTTSITPQEFYTEIEAYVK